jgi:predicted nucleotidyltransferase
MNLLQAIDAVSSFLKEQKVPYVVMGGLAVQYWAEPRATRDVDVMVMVPADRLVVFLQAAVVRFTPRLPDALGFARRYRVLLLSAEDGTPIDISFGIAGYEEQVVQRAASVFFGTVGPVALISAEDLIVHKCVAGRARDIEDVERIMVRQRLSLDLRYIRRWLRDFAPLVDGHDVLQVFGTALRKARARLRKEAGSLILTEEGDGVVHA